MILYDKNHNKLDTDFFTYYDTQLPGKCSKVYIKDDKLLKIYNNDTSIKKIMKKDMFNKLKELDIPNVIKLYDYYFMFDDFLSRLWIDAYTMDFIDRDETNLLYSDIDYICEMALKLEEVAKILAKNHITIFDSHEGNIIFKKNDVTIIDQDQFYFNYLLPYQLLFIKNKKEILNYIRSTLLYESSNENPQFKFDLSKSLYFDINHDTDISKVLKDRFSDKTIYKSLKKM